MVQRKLSPWRVMLAILLLIGIGAGGFFGIKQWRAAQPTTSHDPWFASYVDVTATPTFSFEQMATTTHKDAILSFVVSSQKQPCTPAWGSTYTLDQASGQLDLDRRIARLKQQGGNIAISFGGIKNSELAVGCTDQTALLNAYKSVVDRYNLSTIDLDLEKSGLTDPTAATRRASALAELQKERRAQGKPLAIWVTLPVAPQGLTDDGTNAVAALLAKKVDLAGVNVMTMDYGASLPKGQSMLAGSEAALTQTHRQLEVLYQNAGTHLNSATLWAKLGATPMIGQNDTTNEIFNLDDAKGLNKFAHDHGQQRLSMWSANRDQTCSQNYVDIKIVSSSCSGIDQGKQKFADVLGSNLKGSLLFSAGTITKADPESSSEQAPDDPATSPYPIWSDTGAYLQGTKVVWHHNVYEAKWWTQGDQPDSAVLQSWQTPWELIGPVLPGEKPVPQPTLPAGTYPNWDGNATYNTGDRVLFEGTPYQAKWWSKGQSPAAASSNANGSPWTPLTQDQIQQVLGQKS